MNPRSPFAYPIPHSTFIPVSHESITASGLIRKRKRTKSLATNHGGDDDDAQDENGDERAQTEVVEDADSGRANIWTAINPPAAVSPSASGPSLNGEEEVDAHNPLFYEKPKPVARNIEHRIRNAGYDEDITDALPPLQPLSLQTKHINNLNTVLHICLLRRDWKRAKRAFRLLLVSDDEKDVKDLRLKAIWRLGVEVLSWEGASEEQEAGSGDRIPRDYSKAVEYMKRLINLYPHYKHHVVGKGVNATTILPIMMHFEVLSLQEKISNAAEGAEVTAATEVIEGIGELTDRLKSRQETPPWVDMVEIWKLRGQLQLWAADLCVRYLGDQKGYVKFRRQASRLAEKMKERDIEGWELFVSKGYSKDDDEVEDEEEEDLSGLLDVAQHDAPG